MRNVTLYNFESFCIDNFGECETIYTDRDYILLYSNGRIIKYEETCNKSTSIEICNLKESLFPIGDEESLTALSLTYSFEKNSIFVLLCNGDIVSVEQKDNTGSCYVIGSVSGGLKAVKWSPENELVALVTRNDIVIVMTNDFDPLSEVDLHGGGFGERQFTTVGWGKKETQFRGSEGKYMAQTNVAHADNKADGDNSVKITWRGDAEYFAVSCLNTETGNRYIRIFSKEGILQYTSEDIPGLESPLDWRPSGNLIASIQRLPNKYNVCFIEKNGLKHGDFTLPHKQNDVIVREVKWNLNSNLLALLIEDNTSDSILKPSGNKDAKTSLGEKTILLYTVNNYHWYCKYSIPFPNDTKIIMEWDKHKNNLLHAILVNGKSILHNKYSWIWCTHKSKGRTTEDRAIVAVIDGFKLLLTSFKNGIIPPPMCSYLLEFPTQINAVGFAPSFSDGDSTSSNDLFVQLSNNKIYLYKFVYDVANPNHIEYKVIGKIDYNSEFICNVQWVSPNMFALCVKNCDLMPHLSILEINKLENDISFREKKYSINSPIALMKSYSNTAFVFHDNAGKTHLFHINCGNFNEIHPEQEICLTELEIVQGRDKSIIVFGLDNANKFYINERIVANNITSFHVHQDFLLLTDLKHRLLCFPIESEAENINMGVELDGVSARRIERGSRIVTSVLKDTKVILQMPRGNLECVQPRALSFSVIGKYLNELQYYSAFNIMRLQRINFNLLYDHDPILFEKNIHLFIEQIKDPAWISLFLSELVNEDVTTTMYSVIYKNRSEGTRQEREKSKIEEVCELVEKELESRKDVEKYVLPILTTYIKRGQTHYLERALSKLKNLKEAENRGENPAVTFDEAFRYLLYLRNVEDMYKVALGMYDFDLVLMIATKSQKDPKEYIPFLNDLKKLDISQQKFMIDKYLKRHSKALNHLLQFGDDLACINFIEEHNLFKTALKLIPTKTERYKKICYRYAIKLSTSGMFEEAGIMFKNAGSYQSAIGAFMKTSDWREVISCCKKSEGSDSEREDLYLQLAKSLVDRKMYMEASVVYRDYLRDMVTAVQTLCKGALFEEAIRVAEFHAREDLISSYIKPEAVSQHGLTLTSISRYREILEAQKTRLRVVRDKKEQKRLEAGDGCNGNSEQDAYSEASTFVTHSHAGTRTTNKTFRSAKNRRKQERKLLSLKEGSQYEDLALVASLHNVVSSCVEMKGEVGELTRCLVKVGEETLAEKLQTCFANLLKEVEGSKSEIWIPSLLSGRQVYGPESTSNSISASFVQSDGDNGLYKSIINPKLLISPADESKMKWQLEILKL